MALIKVKFGEVLTFQLQRYMRDLKAAAEYPVWYLSGRSAPDNVWHKRRCICRIAKKFDCGTFIETGTFYGQTISAVQDCFELLLSVELSDRFSRLNTHAFANSPKVKIVFGDSATELERMIADARGRILFWLDGHYSGGDTASGDVICPILAELESIHESGRTDDCILIDDARLFNGRDGYPTLAETICRIRAMNPDYNVRVEGDCIIAVVDRQ